MSEFIGRVFERRQSRGNEYDRVRVVGIIRAEEINEAVIAPVAFGTPEKVDADAFASEYTSEGVEQIERDPHANPRGSWGNVAGSAVRARRGDPVAADIDGGEPLPTTTDAERRLAALEGNE